MSTLEFFLIFLTLTAISSGAIIGWYLCTRGEWNITPDGKWKKTGMIFKYWSLFFEQYRREKKVYFSVSESGKKHKFLEKTRPDLAQKITPSSVEGFLIIDSLSEKELSTMADLLACNLEFSQGDGKMFRLFVNQPIYDIPEWIQKPLSSCPACMSGPYGTAIWLVFLKLQRDAFAWTSHTVMGYFSFGVIFILCLATINTFLRKVILV